MGKAQLISLAKQVALIVVVIVAYDYAKTAYNKSQTAAPAVTAGTAATTAPKTT